MILVGIHGGIGEGKTTLAEAFHQIEPSSAHLESSAVIAEVLEALHEALEEPYETDTYTFVNQWMNKLPSILNKVAHIEVSPLQLQFSRQEARQHPVKFQKLFEHAESLLKAPALAKQGITSENKQLYRAGLQGLGGYLITATTKTIWYDELIRRVEIEANKGTKLCLIGGLRYPADAEVVRAASGIIVEIVRPGTPLRDINDPTEAHRKQIISDTKVINNGSVDDLVHVAKSLYSDSSEGQLKSEYSAYEITRNSQNKA